MITLVVIDSKIAWNSFFNDHGSPSFLQTYEWGEFQKKLGYKIARIGFKDSKNLIGIALILTVKARRGSFLFVPHGPIAEQGREAEVIAALTEYLKREGARNNVDFIRLSPLLTDTRENRELFTDLGYKIAPMYMHAEHTWAIDITKSEEELTAAMRKTTRYLIKRAPKDGVIIEKRDDEAAVDIFMSLYAVTAGREHFTPFSHDYILEELRSFKKTGNGLFLFGKVNGEYLAGALLIFSKSTCFYHQGASIHTKLPVPYLLQWQGIEEAKKRGCQFYNFWGIAKDESKKHPWAGLTQFKKGFGGFQTSFVPTLDIPLSKKYYLAAIFERILRLRRGV